jgi:hypothetical protein
MVMHCGSSGKSHGSATGRIARWVGAKGGVRAGVLTRDVGQRRCLDASELAHPGYRTRPLAAAGQGRDDRAHALWLTSASFW